MLDFELLRAFVAVADCGGFHRAAERLNLTQPTIGQQIKRLELETPNRRGNRADKDFDVQRVLPHCF